MNMKAWAVACCLLASTGSAWSAGGGGGGGGGGGTEAPAVAKDPDFVSGETAVKAEQWPTAIRYMNIMVQKEPGNADAWNYLGYSYRHVGEMDKSFAAYEKALTINPKHREAREYLGEAYLQVGRLDGAEEQLKVLDKLCFLPCEEYTELKEKIAEYKKKNGIAQK